MIKLVSFLAMIIFIPLKTKQHFIPFQDLNQCLLADICNHTWIPECGLETNHTHYRLFLDECDLFEYNCDNNLMYKATNYSDCFSASVASGKCITIASLLTRVQDFYIYYADGRRVMYSYTTPLKSRKRTTYYTLPTTATKKPLTTNWNHRRRYTPQATGKYKPWSDYTANKKRTTHFVDLRETRYHNRPLLEPPPIEFVTERTTKWTTKRTTKPTTKRTTKATTTKTKPTTQILQTGTIGTVLLNKITVWRNGTMFFKVIKGYKAPIITRNGDSNFLE